MAVTCDNLLDATIKGIDCANPSAKGVESLGKIINRADLNLAGVTKSTNDANTISAMPLKSGKVAYDIIQPNKTPFSGTQTEMNEGTYQNTFNHTLSFVIINHGSNIAKVVDELANGEFVVVLQNKKVDGGSSSPYQVYGLEAGLVASSMVRELYNDDTLAGWQVTMTETGVANSAMFVDSSVWESLFPTE